VAVEKLGDFSGAIAHFERAIALRPDYAVARMARAAGVLRLGNFVEGWKEYESRWGLDWMKARQPAAGKPMWDGSELNGKTILVRAEQGMGDVIHAARYFSLVAQRGGKVIAEVHEPLVRLMERVEG